MEEYNQDEINDYKEVQSHYHLLQNYLCKLHIQLLLILNRYKHILISIENKPIINILPCSFVIFLRGNFSTTSLSAGGGPACTLKKQLKKESY